MQLAALAKMAEEPRNQQEWTGLWVSELLPKDRPATYDPLVTFVSRHGRDLHLVVA